MRGRVVVAMVGAGIAGVGCGVPGVWGSLLPATHRASSSAVLAAPPSEVWDTLAAVVAYPTWRTDLQRVEWRADGMAPDWRRDVWVEHGGFGAIPFRVVEADAPVRLVTRIAADDLGFGGTWTWDLAPEGEGTRVTVTEDGVVDNPWLRFLSRYAWGHHATMDGVLADLGARHGQVGEIGHAR